MRRERHARVLPAGFDPLEPAFLPAAAAGHLAAAQAMIRDYVDRGGNENAAPVAAGGGDDVQARAGLLQHLKGYDAALEDAGLPHPDAVELYRVLERRLLEGAVFVQIDGALPLRVRTAAGEVIDAPTDVSRLLAVNRATAEAGLAQPERARLMDWPAQKRDPSAFQETLHDREPRLAVDAYDELCRRIAEDLAPTSRWATEFAAARARLDAALLQQEAQAAAGGPPVDAGGGDWVALDA